VALYARSEKFIIHALDECHLLVQAHVVQDIQARAHARDGGTSRRPCALHVATHAAPPAYTCQPRATRRCAVRSSAGASALGCSSAHTAAARACLCLRALNSRHAVRTCSHTRAHAHAPAQAAMKEFQDKNTYTAPTAGGPA
jgi:hypothetical protein